MRVDRDSILEIDRQQVFVTQLDRLCSIVICKLVFYKSILLKLVLIRDHVDQLYLSWSKESIHFIECYYINNVCLSRKVLNRFKNPLDDDSIEFRFLSNATNIYFDQKDLMVRLILY